MRNPLQVARRRSLIGLDNTGSSGMNYSGAQYSRLTADWIWAPIQSADQEVRWDIARLRARARELHRNNPYVARFAEMVHENVIGHDGMRLQARVANASGKIDVGINDNIEESWANWCLPNQCSADGELSFTDHQQVTITNCAIDGEAMVRILRGYPNDFGFAIQPLDADLLDHTLNRPAGARMNEIRMGVEIDMWGRRVAYHLWTRHLYDINGSGGRERERVPAEDIVFMRRPGRPGQTRSVSWLSPVLLPLKMLGGFAEAELVAARTAASTMGFYLMDPEAEEDPESDAAEGEYVQEVEAGTMSVLPPGVKDIKTFAAQHPNVQFDAFMKSAVRWIAGGLSVSYNSLGNDLESVNYSSIRAGLLAERDHWRTLQRWTAMHYHRRIYSEWLKYATAAGAIELPGRNVARWHAHRWLPRGWPWVDPLKDITAAAASLQLTMDSRGRLLAQEGRDLEEVFRDTKEEADLAQAYGIDLVNVIGAARIAEQASDTPAADGTPSADDGAPPADGTSAKDEGGDRSETMETIAVARTLRTILNQHGNSRRNGHHTRGTNHER